MIKNNCRICHSEDILQYGSTLCCDTQIIFGCYKDRDLFKCNKCNSISVRPIPTEKELSLYYDFYANIDNSKQLIKHRKSFLLIERLALSLRHGKILDIGCGSGELLASLPSSFQKVGLDIASDACKKAKKKGVEVFCSTWELADFNTEFDMVIALDLLEHVNDPSKALFKIGRVLRKGGYVVIETGNAASWAAKTLGEDWCYPAVFGHLQVLSPDALAKLAQNAQIEITSLIKGHHSAATLPYVLYRGMLAYGFRLLKLAFSPLKPMALDSYLLRKLFNRAPPGAILPDHMILIGRKKAKT
jgi:2-polyprenyl-3-methyl-5-hydroxy-6-metoxy-1,4-benzoquinol methylase